MTHPTFDEEKLLWQRGYTVVVGIDEVGRGCFAGPVVAAAVVFPKDFKPEADCEITNVCDSKLLPSHKRELLDPIIKSHCLTYAIETIGLETINEKGIGFATNLAMQKTVKKVLSNYSPASPRLPVSTHQINQRGELSTIRYTLLVDGYLPNIFSKENAKGIINGDKKSFSIAAASIIAKVYRDKLMTDLDLLYPNYNFGKHKGYGTREHQEAIKQFGLSTLHRTSFNLTKFL